MGTPKKSTPKKVKSKFALRRVPKFSKLAVIIFIVALVAGGYLVLRLGRAIGSNPTFSWGPSSFGLDMTSPSFPAVRPENAHLTPIMGASGQKTGYLWENKYGTNPSNPASSLWLDAVFYIKDSTYVNRAGKYCVTYQVLEKKENGHISITAQNLGRVPNSDNYIPWPQTYGAGDYRNGNFSSAFTSNPAGYKNPLCVHIDPIGGWPGVRQIVVSALGGAHFKVSKVEYYDDNPATISTSGKR